MIDYHVHLIQFPNSKTKETITENEDGSYSIFIESSLSHEEQQRAFKHAMKHILNADFHKNNVNKVEAIAHSD